MIKVCHLTSVHKSNDVRIFMKECRSLANNGYDVSLIAPDAKTEIIDNVKIIGVLMKQKGRLYRMIYTTKLVYQKALQIDADIYHLHDPELLQYGLKLTRKGKKVIFDSHEDVPALLSEKEWIPIFFRKLMVSFYTSFEKRCLQKFSATISVTPLLTNRLKKINQNTYQITNFPIVDKNFLDERKWEKAVCFAGGISKQWLHENVIAALSNVDNIRYNLAGESDSDMYLQKLMALKSWNKVNFIGKIPFNEVYQFLQTSIVGIALNDYVANVGFKEGSLGNTKLFEYMQAGIPVICTDFHQWKNVIESAHCGICVNPHDIDAIAQAITYFIQNPDIAKQMGENGRKAVEKQYNWLTQEKILLQLYKDIQ